MKKNLKENILKLKKEGKSIREISEFLNCAASTVSYHLYERTKQSTKERAKKPERKAAKESYYLRVWKTNPRNNLRQKYNQFFRSGHRENKTSMPKLFTFEEFLTYAENHSKCYLTGEVLNFEDSSSFSLDHIVPVSKGGSNEFSNLGLCTWKANKAKADMTLEEFKILCSAVLKQ